MPVSWRPDCLQSWHKREAITQYQELLWFAKIDRTKDMALAFASSDASFELGYSLGEQFVKGPRSKP